MGASEAGSSSLILAVAAFAHPTAANAAVPCRDRIYNDWYGDGKIATTYPVSCYRDALKHVPTDARDVLEPRRRHPLRDAGCAGAAKGQTKVPAQVGKRRRCGPAAPAESSSKTKTTTHAAARSGARAPSR